MNADVDATLRDLVDGGACTRCGRDTCEQDCAPRRPKQAPNLRFKTAAELMREPAPALVVEGLAWAGCVTVLVGESGAGKSFVALDLVAALADGRAWHGRDVRRGSVAYVSFEGDALGLRLKALHEAGFSLEDVYVLPARDPITPQLGRDGAEQVSMGEAALAEALAVLAARLAAEGKPPLVLIVIDTLRASHAGSEDSSEDVSAYLRAVRRLLGPHPLAAGLVVHHAGWQDGQADQRKRRERGSSALRGNVDATLYLEVTEVDRESHAAYLTLTTLKVRDAERPAALRLVRRRVDLLAQGPDGGPVTSCVIERDPRRREDIEAEQAAAATAAAEAEAAALDQRVLALVQEHAVTSLSGLRALLGAKRDATYDAVARLVRQGHLAPPARQRAPYTLTASGCAFMSRPQSSPVVPESSPERLRRVVPGPPLTGDGSTRAAGDCSSTASSPRGELA